MTPVTPEELSGYLDGELSAERAGRIEAELAVNEELAAAFAALQAADGRWRMAADSACFQPPPVPRLMATTRPSPGRMVAVLPPLVGLALLPRLVDAPELTLASNGVVLALVLVWVARMVAADVADAMPDAAMVSATAHRDGR